MKFAQWRTRSLLLLIHFFTLVNGYNIYNYHKSFSSLQIYDVKTYNDGTVLLHMINENVKNCSTPKLYFRLIHSNGTLNSLDIPIKEIPSFNYCQIIENIVYQFYIKVWPLKPNFIYVTYVNSSKIEDAAVYGLLIDWSGNILSNSFISSATIGFNRTVSPPGSLYYSKEFNNEFLYVGQLNIGDLIWSYFTFPTTKNDSIKLLNKGVIKGDDAINVSYFGYSKFMNEFYLILARSFNQTIMTVVTYVAEISNGTSTYNETKSSNETSFKLSSRVEAYFINAKGTAQNITILESPEIPDLNVISTAWSLDSNSSGISCLLYLATGKNLNNSYGLRVTMFNSTRTIGPVEEVPAVNVTGAYNVDLYSLTFGGYLRYLVTAQYSNQSTYGYILNATGYVESDWPLPQPTLITARGQAYDVLPNNTFVAATHVDNRNFSIITAEIWRGISGIPTEGELPKTPTETAKLPETLTKTAKLPETLTKTAKLPETPTKTAKLPEAPTKAAKSIPTGADVGYHNPLIGSSYPPLNGLISPEITEMNITYLKPVVLSSQNITIYQILSTTGFPLLRQTFSASSEFVKLSGDNKTLIFNIFKSTCNKPASTYNIKVESDIVRLKDTGEPVPGIPDNVWNVTTENRTIGANRLVGASTVAFIRLSPPGADEFNTLDEIGKKGFINELGNELAYMVPIAKERITPLVYQKDQEKRMLIAYKISPANNIVDESAEDIVNDLQALISHGNSTLASRLEYTKYLDGNYGFVKKHDILRDNRVQLVIFAAYFISLVLLIFIIFCINRQAKVGVVLKFVFALIAYVFYVIFVYENSRDVDQLAIASILLLIIPFLIKLGLGLFLTSRESSVNPVFRTWVKDHTMIAVFFTFLSSVDLDSLKVINSGIEESLHAPISLDMSKSIDMYECFGFFIRDLPVLAILVLYYKLTLDYSIVPFFALGSLLILVIYVIIWRFIRGCAWCLSGDSGVGEESVWNNWSKRLSLLSKSSDTSDSYEMSASGLDYGETSKGTASASFSRAKGSSSAMSSMGSVLNKLGLGFLISRKHKHRPTLFDPDTGEVGEIGELDPEDAIIYQRNPELETRDEHQDITVYDNEEGKEDNVKQEIIGYQ